MMLYIPTKLILITIERAEGGMKGAKTRGVSVESLFSRQLFMRSAM